MDEGANEWWRWRMYRQAAAYINDPSRTNEQQLRELIDAYRSFRIAPTDSGSPEPSAGAAGAAPRREAR